MKRYPYFYTTLRYVHDIATQEFFVVGVVVYSPSQRFIRFHLRRTLGKAGEIIGGEQLGDFRSIMRMMESRCNQATDEMDATLLLGGDGARLEDVISRLIQTDDSALQWAPVRNGLSTDLDQTAKRLFARYCEKYDRPNQHKRITDRDAWKKVESKLKDRRVDAYFTEKKIQGKVDDVSFPFAWKNGLWHCIEPVSFDYADSDAIKNKAHRHIGKITTIRDAAEDFKVYYLATPPSNMNLRGSFEKAIALLKTAPHKKLEVLSTEAEQDRFLDAISKQISHAQPNALQ